MRKLKFVTWLLIILLSINSIAYAAPSQANRNNIAPTISLNAAPVKKPVDIVILTDYTDTKLSALNNRIDALKAEFSAVNVDPVFHIVSDLKKIGTQNDVLYWYRRYARFTCKSSYHEWWSNWDQKGGVYNQTVTVTLLWEQRQGLANTPGSLPNRNPTNVSFTMSNMLYETRYIDGYPYKDYYYNVYITCSNDVKTSGTIKVDWGNNQSKADHYESYGAMSNESVSIDKNWNREEKIKNVTYDIYSLDFSKLNNLSLRPGSDRHMVLISDGEVKNFGAGAGNYFCFGDMTDSFMNYIAENNFELYGVVPDDTKNMTLLPDKVLKVKPLGESTLLYMQNGDVMRLGDPVMAAQLSQGEKMVPQPASDLSGNVVEMYQSSYYIYLFRDNGLVSYIRKGTNDVVNILSGITKVYNVSNSYLYAINTNGKVYQVQMYNASVESLGNSFFCDKIVSIDGYYCIYIDNNGVPYMRQHYIISPYYGDYYYYFQRARIKNRDTDAVSSLGDVKDIVSYRPTGSYNTYITLVLYTSGTVQQFTGVSSSYIYSGRYEYSYYELSYEPSYLLNETNVDRIEFTGYSIILYKKDGTVKMLATDYTQGWNEDGDPYWYPTPRNYLVNVPLSNATSNFKSKINLGYFITNNDGTTYLYRPIVPNMTPVIGSNLINLGSGIKEIGELFYSNYWQYLYLLYNDGTLRYLKLYSTNNNIYEDVTLQYKVKNIYSNGENVYIVLNDGSILGAGKTNYGQLGYKGYIVDTLISPIASSLSFDTTKKYMSLYDIFRNIANSEFFAAGQYTDAFNKIYNSYQNNGDGKIYVLLGEDIEYQSIYSDYENDPEYTRRWSISHDPNYFDNSMGLSLYHNPTGFTDDPPVKLDKVGKYIINLKVRDNPKNDLRFLSDTDADKNYYKWSLGEQNLTVYVHRQPIAKQRIIIEDNGNGTYTLKAFDAGSYDLDHTSRADKGIAAREWRWRDDSHLVWHYEQMDKSDCDPQKVYTLQLRVRDLEGTWSDYNTIEIANNPPIALFSIDKNPIFDNEILLVKDQSAVQSFATLTRWHWIVKKYNEDDTLPDTDIQNDQFSTSNDGTGELEGYDINVKTDYSDTGAGKYRMYLRVKDSNGMWSDEGTDSSYNLSNMYFEDFVVQESFKMTDFRVILIRDFHLEPYYNIGGKYQDSPIYVDSMAIDSSNFMAGGFSLVPGFSSLTKGYLFEFEIDTNNFNGDNDTVEIEPSFYSYTSGVPGTRGPESDLYWEDSNKEIHKAGEGGHSSWARIVLDESNRTITGESTATWRGEYFIPATSWLVPLGTSAANAKESKIDADIIVNFVIKGYRDGEEKYNYNEKQWPIERTTIKSPYQIGDVIRYDYTKSCLDDKKTIINRP